MNNSIDTYKPQKTRFSVAIQTQEYKNLVNSTLSDTARARRFVASITSAVAVTPALHDCDAKTMVAAALLGESLNLSPSPQLGQYYLVPFECAVKDKDGNTMWLLDAEGNHLKDKKGKWLAVKEKKAQFVLGYKGYIQLAIRSGYYKKINVVEIKEGELTHFDPLNEVVECILIDDYEKREAAETVGYYAFFEYLNGFRKGVYWSKDKMLTHADTYSPSFSKEAYKKLINGEIPDNELYKYSSFWYKNFDDMAKKTLLRHIISHWGIMSIEMQNAFESDASFVRVDNNGNFITTDESKIIGSTEETENVAEAEEIKVDMNDL